MHQVCWLALQRINMSSAVYLEISESLVYLPNIALVLFLKAQ